MASSALPACVPLGSRDSWEDRKKTRPPGPGLMPGMFQYFMAARQRKTDREIAMWLGQRGGKFTDSVERELERWLLGP
jgi:hypothetical protein